MSLLSVHNLKKVYTTRFGGNKVEALKNINFSVEEGEYVAIMGESGSGKTTLLNLIGTLDQPDSGEIYFKGKKITGYSQVELAHFRNRELGFVFQMHHLLPQCTLWENVLLPVLPIKKVVGKAEKEWAEHLLRKVGIWEQRNQKPSELSGGECQRTAVVRALINKPQLILADEPTGALDEQNAGHLTDLLNHLSGEEGVSLIVVTHSSELASQMDQVYHLKNGILQ